MVQAANVVASASTIAAARDAFGPLTDAVVARVKADAANAGSSDLRLGYCPMVKKTWVQRGEQVKNPYYGPAMLTCGEMKPLK
jgi:Cu(I)/Ag(I) efflux system membrane fusion protein